MCALALPALLFVPACSSLPTLSPDLSRRPTAPVQLAGARGPLDAAQSQAVPTRLARRGADTDIFERHLAIEEALTESPLTTGSAVLVVDGRFAFLGGINISSVYSGGSRAWPRSPAVPGGAVAGPAWRDTDLRLEGLVVADLQRILLQAWTQQGGPPLASKDYFPPPRGAGSELVRAIASPPEEPFNLIHATTAVGHRQRRDPLAHQQRRPRARSAVARRA